MENLHGCEGMLSGSDLNGLNFKSSFFYKLKSYTLIGHFTRVFFLISLQNTYMLKVKLCQSHKVKRMIRALGTLRKFFMYRLKKKNFV